MNIFKAITLLTAIFITTAAFANEPQLIMINNPKKITKAEKEENLQKFEINNEELGSLYSFKPVKKINKTLASR